MKRILIVDNDKTTVDTISKMISAIENYRVIKAYGGKQAFSKAKMHRPDLIFIDIMMPNIDGITLAKKLFNNSDTKDIPVVLFSALNIKSAIPASNDLKRIKNIKAFLEKPFTIKELADKLNFVFNKK